MRTLKFRRIEGTARHAWLQNKNGAEWPRGSHRRPAILLDLGFAEFDMLARNGVILLLDQLVRHGARVLLGDVVEAGVRRRHELDLDGDRFGHVKTSEKWE